MSLERCPQNYWQCLCLREREKLGWESEELEILKLILPIFLKHFAMAEFEYVAQRFIFEACSSVWWCEGGGIFMGGLSVISLLVGSHESGLL